MNFVTNRPLLAFVHIEKAAGQTFIRILENSYIFRHARVAPLKREHNGVFTAEAMRTILRINPFLKAISGHSVCPWSDLHEAVPNVRYITIFREPLARYISHYQYWVQRMGKNISFEEFLDLEPLKDFQTKKIAGCADVTKAKKVLKDRFFLVGMVERFDEFLFRLQAKIAPEKLNVGYGVKNAAKTNEVRESILRDLSRYEGRILANNQLDTELYDYVKSRLLKGEAVMNFPTVKRDSSRLGYASNLNATVVGKVYRSLYFGPLVKFIRSLNGLRPIGSY